jgi:hypothetical protein
MARFGQGTILRSETPFDPVSPRTGLNGVTPDDPGPRRPPEGGASERGPGRDLAGFRFSP